MRVHAQKPRKKTEMAKRSISLSLARAKPLTKSSAEMPINLVGRISK